MAVARRERKTLAQATKVANYITRTWNFKSRLAYEALSHQIQRPERYCGLYDTDVLGDSPQVPVTPYPLAVRVVSSVVFKRPILCALQHGATMQTSQKPHPS